MARHLPVLHIRGDADVAHAAPGQGSAAGDVRDDAHVRRPHHALVVDRDVLEERQLVDLLLIVRADQIVVGLTGQRDDRNLIQLGIVEPVQKMDRPGTRGRHAAAQPASVLGVGSRHESCRFLVAHLDEADLVRVLAKRFHDSVDAVARQAKDRVDAPTMDRLNQTISGRAHQHLHRRRNLELARVASGGSSGLGFVTPVSRIPRDDRVAGLPCTPRASLQG